MFPVPARYAYASFQTLEEETYLRAALEHIRIRESETHADFQGVEPSVRFLALRFFQSLERDLPPASCLRESFFLALRSS